MSISADRIAELEGLLKRRDDELRSKEASFAEALAREQSRSRDRDAKDAARRADLQQKNASLMEERGVLRQQLSTLKDVEDELRRSENDVKQARRETVDVKLKAAEERRDLEAQVQEGRRREDKLAHEISDLRCSLSILDHKLQYTEGKLSQQDSQADQVTRLQEEVTQLRASLESAERKIHVDDMRFQRDRKGYEDKISKLTAELAAERQAPSRMDLVAKYESGLEAKRDVTAHLLRCVAALSRQTPMPANMDDHDGIMQYVEKAFATRSSRPGSGIFGSVTGVSPQVTPRRAADAPVVVAGVEVAESVDGTEACSESIGVSQDHITVALLDALRLGLEGVVASKRPTLLRRFVNSVQANAEDSKLFGETSGFPDPSSEDPHVLVSQIAVVTNERDALIVSLNATQRKLRLAEEQAKSAAVAAASSSPPPAASKAAASSSSPRFSISSGSGKSTVAAPPNLSASPAGRSVRSPGTAGGVASRA